MKKALVKIGRGTFRTEVADTVHARIKGLSGRGSMARDEAMLFLFPLAWRYSFWMKSMNFPLDIVWIRKGVVVDISEDIPAPGGSVFKLQMVRPKKASDAVLEINAGLARELGIRIGDKVQIGDMEAGRMIG